MTHLFPWIQSSLQLKLNDIYSRYLKVTLEEAFADSHEDVFMGLIDNDQVLQFTVMLNNFKLQNFNLVTYLIL